MELKTSVEVVAYNLAWPTIYNAECTLLLANIPDFIAIEHIGSTAVVGQRAKPIIDIMASVTHLQDIPLTTLNDLDYILFEMGMENRLFFRKQNESKQVFHLHIVEHSTYHERKERHLRDYLRSHPEAVHEYGNLKVQLATEFAQDSIAYTRAKTTFIQSISDKIQDERGLPRINVWED